MSDADARIGGRYRLDRQLASGGMGTVWLGWDESLRRAVAIKRLHLRPGLSDAEREDAVDRAMREGRITAKLHHPNAVPVYDVVDDEDGPCLVMQYVPSRSLAAVVTDDGPLPPAAVARVGTQIAAALAAAHRVGIVHRDVKPANILIADDGTARITDFGVSHARDDVAITSTGMVTGTPGYLAPEVARGETSGPASDVYSLGSTLYLAVEGEAPYGADGNPMAVLHRVASGRPRPAQQAGPLTDMLRQMMAPAPADRPSMVEIAGRMPDVHPLAEVADDTDSPDDAVTQVLRRVAAPVTEAVRTPAPADDGDTQIVRARPAPPPARPLPAVAAAKPAARDRRRLLVPLVAAVLVVLLGAVIALVVVARSNGDDDVAGRTPVDPAPRTTATTSPRSSTSAARPSSEPSTTAAPSTTAPTARPTPSRPAPARQRGPATNAQLAAALVEYFQLIPGDLDTAWSRLTPGFQQGRAGGRGTFDSFWGSVSRVDVQGAAGDAPNQATATLVYHYRDGRVVSQQTSFRIVRQGSVLKIAAEY